MTSPPSHPPDSSFESELRQFSPTPGSPHLRRRIAAELESPALPPKDRFLLAYMSLGAAAAILILTMLTLDFVQSPPASSNQTSQATQNAAPSALAQTRALLAQYTTGKDPLTNQ